MNFQSDNQSSIFPEIIKYLEEIDLNSSPAYNYNKLQYNKKKCFQSYLK